MFTTTDVPSMFGACRALQRQVDEFLDTVAQGTKAFEEGTLIHGGGKDRPKDRLIRITQLNHRARRLVRNVERELYIQMLLPDSRVDVTDLMHQIQQVLDAMQSRVEAVAIEQPDAPKKIGRIFQGLVSTAMKCVSAMVCAARAYFSEVNAMGEHLAEITCYEAECHKMALGLKKRIFDTDLRLQRKMHLRDYVDSVDALADEAARVGDRLSVLLIKRSL